MTPHQLAVAGAHPDPRARGEVHNRVNASDIRRDAGRIARAVAQIFRPPNLFAGHLVERNYTRSPPTRSDDQTVAVHQRGLADQPAGIASAELFQNVFAPDRRTVAGVQTGQIAVFGQRVNAVTVDRGSRTRPVAHFFIHLRSHSPEPDDLAIGAMEAKNKAHAPAGSLREDAAAFDRNRAVTFAQVRN